MSLKVGILSLGCPRNLVDSETILGVIKNKDYTLVDDITKSDIAIINTCSFIEEAKKESIDAILDLIQLKKNKKIKKIIVAGCLAQQYGKKLTEELKEVDAFIGRLNPQSPNTQRISITPGHYTYLKIAEGCNNHCSYCVIPKIKGPLESRKINEVIEEVVKLDAAGQIKELNVIAQDTTNYGRDLKERTSLDVLLRKILDNTKNIRWLRMLYMHPAHLDSALIKLIKSHERICNYIDLPIQHICDRLLKLMNRRVSRSRIKELICEIRERIPEVVLRTSIIVGFPSESEKDFQELLDFISEMKFERLGAFIYSREEGTKAYDFKDQVKENVKLKRFNDIMKLQQEISAEFNRKQIGKEFLSLVEEKEGEFYRGRTYMDAPEVDGEVLIKGKRLKIGEFQRVKITDSQEYDLIGQTL